jgi:hypothetical protein
MEQHLGGDPLVESDLAEPLFGYALVGDPETTT